MVIAYSQQREGDGFFQYDGTETGDARLGG